jgi:hypothetical protein
MILERVITDTLTMLEMLNGYMELMAEEALTKTGSIR